jgi:uncharacterized protein
VEEKDGAGPRPTLPGERIVALDVIRGFAMFGVLVAYCVWSLGTLPEEAFSPLDRALAAGVGFLVDAKFYTLLAFLFGLGFQLQLGRAGDSDAAAVRLYRRRLMVLAVLGLLHAVLLRNGDILFPYAVAGFLLIPFRRATDRVLLNAVRLILLWLLVAHWLWEAIGAPNPERPDTAGMSYIAGNSAWLLYWYATAPLTWPLNLALFLLGLHAGRHRLIARVSGDRGLALRIVAAGVAGAILFYLVRLGLRDAAPPAPAWRDAAQLLFTFHAWSLAAAYAALLLLALRTKRGQRLLQPLAAVGRMALTNYLLQAGLIVPLCLVFGWFDRFTPSSALLLALGVFALQVPFSLLWLRRFDFGPAEWLWRLLTYGRAPSTRRLAESPL